MRFRAGGGEGGGAVQATRGDGDGSAGSHWAGWAGAGGGGGGRRDAGDAGMGCVLPPGLTDRSSASSGDAGDAGMGCVLLHGARISGSPLQAQGAVWRTPWRRLENSVFLPQTWNSCQNRVRDGQRASDQSGNEASVGSPDKDILRDAGGGGGGRPRRRPCRRASGARAWRRARQGVDARLFRQAMAAAGGGGGGGASSSADARLFRQAMAGHRAEKGAACACAPSLGTIERPNAVGCREG